MPAAADPEPCLDALVDTSRGRVPKRSLMGQLPCGAGQAALSSGASAPAAGGLTGDLAFAALRWRDVSSEAPGFSPRSLREGRMLAFRAGRVEVLCPVVEPLRGSGLVLAVHRGWTHLPAPGGGSMMALSVDHAGSVDHANLVSRSVPMRHIGCRITASPRPARAEGAAGHQWLPDWRMSLVTGTSGPALKPALSECGARQSKAKCQHDWPCHGFAPIGVASSPRRRSSAAAISALKARSSAASFSSARAACRSAKWNGRKGSIPRTAGKAGGACRR
jgi:hypothetical protein